MQKEIIIGKEPTYKFKDIIIDERYGKPIYIDNVCVGGLLVSKEEENGYIFVKILGIEIKPEYRRQGIASFIINSMKADIILGAIMDECHDFWRSVGAVIQITPNLIPDRLKHTVHTDKPGMFYISKNPVLIAQMEEWYKKVPDIRLT